MMESSSPHRPLLITHRAGNHPDQASAAEAAGADYVEADVWLYHGRLEVRHEKTMRGVPILWDRWMLAPAWKPRVLLADVLGVLKPETGILLDLKGNDRRLSATLLEAVAAETRPLAVCSQNWRLVDALADDGEILRVHSVGSRRALRSVIEHLRGRERAAVSVHRRLLDAATVQALKDVASVVVTWPVNTRAQFDAVARWGVDGVTSDDLRLMAEVSQAGSSDPGRSRRTGQDSSLRSE